MYIFIATLLPPLFVFGLYHLATWFNVFGINNFVFWRQVALISAIAHLFLATGFFLFSYYSLQSEPLLVAQGFDFEGFLFIRSGFWRLMLIFDTLAMLFTLGLFSLADWFSVSLIWPLHVTLAIVYGVGTFQWYWVGGGVAASIEKIWEGLKTDDEELDWL